MSARIKRLQLLAAELKGSIEALAGRITPGSAAVFLDTLARCEQFEAAEMEMAGASELVELARAARASEPAALAKWAADGLHLGALGDSAYALAEKGTPEAILAWGADLLRAANLSPWLPASTQERLGETLFDCCRIIEANPAPFAALAALARDRRQFEGPAFGEPLSDLLETLEEVETLARLDGDSVSISDTDRPLFDRLLLAAAGSEVLDDARDALEDVAGWKASVVHLVSRQRAPAPQLRFAASDEEPDAERVLLRRFDDGEFLLAAIDGELAIEWWGKGKPGLALGGAPLEAEATLWGLRWRLSPAGEAAALVLEMCVDGERHPFDLPLR
jgi:hypothetical protein